MKRNILFCTTLLIVVFTNAQVNLKNGLMAYYPFSGNAIDSSGNGNNPSFNNATLTTDRFGNANSAYSFDGKSSYMQIPNSATLDSGNNVSISFWMKVNVFNTDLCSGNYLFSRGGTQPYVTNYNIVFGNAPYGTVQNINYCKTPIDTSHESIYGMGTSDLTPIHTGTWYHVVLTNNGSVSIMYLNGNIVSAQSASIIINTADLILGRDYPQGAAIDPYWFNGVLDDIRIYNRAITGNEVTALYTAPNPAPSQNNSCANSNNSQLVIRMDTANNNTISTHIGNVPKLGINNNSKEEVALFAWTDNTDGFPFYNQRTLQRFDISNIPANAIVNSAKLYYFAKTVNAYNGVAGQPTYGSNNTVLLQKCSSSWLTNTVSMNNLPTVETTTQKVLPQSTNTAEDYVVDITDFAQSWIKRPDSNFGFMLRMQTENNPYNSMIFEAGQATDTTRDARLEICYSVPVVTPVSLSSFAASAINPRYVSLQFSTTNETNTAAINIERSYDGINFILVNTIVAKGNLNTNQYSVADKVDQNAIVAYYRLKLINKNGTNQYSNILSVQLLSMNNSISIYPNPAKKFVMVNGKNVTGINIIDYLGRLVSTRKGLNISSSLNKVELNLSHGTYLLQILMTDGKMVNKKLNVE